MNNGKEVNPVAKHELDRLIKYVGGTKGRLARYLGVVPSYVTKYVKMGGLPAVMAVRVERKTNGEFKAINLSVD